MTAVIPASTYLPIAIGAVVAGAACLLFIHNVNPSSEEGQEDNVLTDDLRHLAIRIVCCVYVLLGGAFVAVALAMGGTGFIVASGAVFGAAVCVAFLSWSPDAVAHRTISSKGGAIEDSPAGSQETQTDQTR
jgi:hypothetical protein